MDTIYQVVAKNINPIIKKNILLVIIDKNIHAINNKNTPKVFKKIINVSIESIILSSLLLLFLISSTFTPFFQVVFKV